MGQLGPMESVCVQNPGITYSEVNTVTCHNRNVDLSNALVLTRMPLLSVECRTNLPRFLCQRKIMNAFDLNITCIKGIVGE